MEPFDWLFHSVGDTPMEDRYWKEQGDEAILELGSTELHLTKDGKWYLNDTSGG